MGTNRNYKITLPIERWVYEDEVFQDLANSIDPTLNDDMKMAQALYEGMLETFAIPGELAVKKINRNGVRSYDDFASMLSIHTAILKYEMSDDPIRGNLIAACYFSLKMHELDTYDCAEKYFGSADQIPESYMVFFKDYGPDCTLMFDVPGNDWTKSAHTAVKVYNR